MIFSSEFCEVQELLDQFWSQDDTPRSKTWILRRARARMHQNGGYVCHFLTKIDTTLEMPSARGARCAEIAVTRFLVISPFLPRAPIFVDKQDFYVRIGCTLTVGGEAVVQEVFSSASSSSFDSSSSCSDVSSLMSRTEDSEFDYSPPSSG